jgi:acetylglutamate kinase
LTRPEPPIVVKLGGETLADQHATPEGVAPATPEGVAPATLEGVAEAARTRHIVVVHGGGKRLSGWLDRLGVQSRFEDGRRVTDDEALSVAVAVLRGLVNSELVASLQRLGCPAVGISGADGGLVQAERVPALGRVGRVVGARPAIVNDLLRGGFVPVVAPIALDERGELCNVNADEVAAGLAATLHGRLVLLSDTDGVRDRDGQKIARLDPAAVEALIANGIISGGMIPKVRGALAAVAAGSGEVVIADGRSAGSLARALDDPSYGTRLVAQASDGPG